MDKLRSRLANAFSASGHMAIPEDSRLVLLTEKLGLLQSTSRYTRLISNLLSANNDANLRSFILEVAFAFQFESVGKTLGYEVRRRPDDQTSVDFLRQADSGEQLCIEMRLVQQRKQLTTLFEEQLRRSPYFGTILDGDDDREELVRLQRLILEKAVNRTGEIIKFLTGVTNTYNFVAVEVSELQLGMIDKADCLLAAYGDPAVYELARRRLFGLFQEPRSAYPPDIQEVAVRFAPFRKSVHGILFLKKVPPGSLGDFNLEYLLIHNRALVTDEEAMNVLLDLNGALNVWESTYDMP